MTYLFLILIVVLLFTIVVLIYKNQSIKKLHSKNMEQLQTIINSLNQRQKLLNDKVFISDQYNLNHRIEMKNLGDDVVQLQKVFIEIISNKNSN